MNLAIGAAVKPVTTKATKRSGFNTEAPQEDNGGQASGDIALRQGDDPATLQETDKPDLDKIEDKGSRAFAKAAIKGKKADSSKVLRRRKPATQASNDGSAGSTAAGSKVAAPDLAAIRNVLSHLGHK